MTRVQLLELRDALLHEQKNWKEIYERVRTNTAKHEARRNAAHCNEKLRLVQAEVDGRR